MMICLKMSNVDLCVKLAEETIKADIYFILSCAI